MLARGANGMSDVIELEKRIEYLEREVKSIGLRRDRDIPIKPRFQIMGDMSIPVWFCPCCEKKLSAGNCDSHKPNYCEDCGQKIDWR